MAQLRIGHDQIVLYVDNIRLDKGALELTCSGYPDRSKLPKLTGSQPFVLVCDDGSIWTTWHADCTESFAAVRRDAKYTSTLTFVQRFDPATAHST